MKQLFILFAGIFSAFAFQSRSLSGDDILKKVDRNMYTETRIITSTMTIHGRRENRTIESESWQRGTSDAFTEYLSPVREKGTKMLKLKDLLWTYSPSTDRTILLSQHMLRQSVMGSDLSYEDMMEDPRLPNLYSAVVAAEDTAAGRECWVLNLTAKKDDIAYYMRTLWIDKERYTVLREHLFAKSGKLLKTVDVTNVSYIKNRWIATGVLYKDVMKEGIGTEFNITSIKIDADIPDHIFSKASLRR